MMQEIAMSHNPATGNSFAARMPYRNKGTVNLTASIARRAKAVLRHWQKRRAIRTLQELDDWTLYDLGVSRNEIRGLVDDLVCHPPRKISPHRDSPQSDASSQSGSPV
jgi:uncharacterized protein YjiS (DUF1127 family)